MRGVAGGCNWIWWEMDVHPHARTSNVIDLPPNVKDRELYLCVCVCAVSFVK